MTRLGYQIPNFTYPGVGPDALFDVVVEQAKAADRSGFDTVLVMDHFYQLPYSGDPEQYMLECYTTLAALARETSSVRLSALVTGNTYRNPAFLAKTVTTLDIVSGGRAQLGIGAGWYELEHDSYGFEFGTFTDRFQKLEESLQIVIPMLRGARPTFEGEHYRAHEAMNEPPPISRIPVMIGGSGERKTLRLVAQYADESNLICTLAETARKLDVLAGHCEAVGRDRSQITVTQHVSVCIAPTHDQAVADLDADLERNGRTGEMADMARARTVLGDPDEVAEQLSAYLDAGVDGWTVSATANGMVPGRLELLGETASKLLV
ncbi:MAG TPA: LLM class F420-dependent oxidoreductase [Acidimicrobiales bacterium]